MARDKELSTFDTRTLRTGASYDGLRSGWRFIDRGTITIAYDPIRFDYKDFRDLRVGGIPPRHEPLYGLDANVVQLFLSLWFPPATSGIAARRCRVRRHAGRAAARRSRRCLRA